MPGDDDQKLDRWVEAKRTRDFQLADRLRAELEAHGIQPEVARPHVWESGGRGRGTPSGVDWMPQMGRGSGMMNMLPVGRGGGLPMPGSKGGGKGGKGGGKGGGQGCPPNIDPKVGDWQCVSCGNWNWARRKECNQCNSAKEGLLRVTGAAAGSKREGLGGGFSEFDSEESERRKRRAVEERAEKEERKAEKKKCQFCHRAACIC